MIGTVSEFAASVNARLSRARRAWVPWAANVWAESRIPAWIPYRIIVCINQTDQ